MMSVANKKHQDILRPSLWGRGWGRGLLVSWSVGYLFFLPNYLLS